MEASEQAVHVPWITAAQPVSHPSAALPLMLNLLAMHVTAVQLLALAVPQAVHVPSVTAAHPSSHPSVALPLVSNLLAMHVTAVHPPMRAE